MHVWTEKEEMAMKLDAVTDGVLQKIDDLGFKQEGAYNLRYNGQPLCHGDTEHIKIRRKRTSRELMCISAGKPRENRSTSR